MIALTKEVVHDTGRGILILKELTVTGQVVAWIVGLGFIGIVISALVDKIQRIT